MTDPTLHSLDAHTPFADRHIGLRPDDVATMLERIGYASLDDQRDRQQHQPSADELPRGERQDLNIAPPPLDKYEAERSERHRR